jgi:LAGLIDADG-like domain
MREADLGYIAGFFEAEGSASTPRRRARKNGSRPEWGCITFTQKDPAVLYWLQATLDMGFVYHRRQSERANKPGSPISKYRIAAQEDVVRFIRLVYPHIKSPAKKEQLRRAYKAAAKGRHIGTYQDKEDVRA